MLVYHKEYNMFLEKLRSAGVVHIKQRNADVSEFPEIQKLQAEYSSYMRLVASFEKLAPENKEVASSCEDAPGVVARAEELSATLENLKQALHTVLIYQV